MSSVELEVKVRYVLTYINKGHQMYPEDNWTSKRIVSNEHEVYEFFKDVYRRDAHNHNDYPMNGDFFVSQLKVHKESFIEMDGQQYINNRQFELSSDEKNMVDEWVKNANHKLSNLITRMRYSLPKIRAFQEVKKQKVRDLVDYNFLKTKFE